MAESRMLFPPMAARLLDGLKNLWGTGELSDITLTADGIEFPAHRTVLALSSDYFMAMFRCPMVEASQNTVELKGVSTEGLEPILQFIYTGHLPITTSNICNVIMAASHLQMDAALEVCTDNIHKVMSTTNCVDLKNVSRLCSLQDIEYFAEDYLIDNFAGVIQEGAHCGLDLRTLLLCHFRERSEDTDAILFSPERKVFSLMVDWIRHEEERMAHIDRVMEVVRFPLMSLNDIAEVVAELPVLVENPACLRLIEEARRYLDSPWHQQVLRQTKKTRLRNNPSIVVLTMHPDTGKLLMHALCQDAAFNPDAERRGGKWLHLVDMEAHIPNITLTPDTVASIVINDFLIVVGVYENGADKEIPPRSCYLFDPRRSGWTKMADMNMGRYRPALVFQRQKLYALGGASSLTSLLNMDSIECYNFNDNTWSDVAKMPAKLRNHAACSLDDHIFICGGMREGGTLSYAVYLFDPMTMSSQSNQPMPFACQKHALYNIGDKVYMVWPREGLLRSYQQDGALSWTKFWVRLGGPKIPTESQAVHVNNNVFFIDGVIVHSDSDSEESITDDSMADLHGHRFHETRHGCVEVVVGDICQGAGKVYRHEDYPAGLGSPLVAAGIRLPWHMTNRLLKDQY